jgi:hypothetical protein
MQDIDLSALSTELFVLSVVSFLLFGSVFCFGILSLLQSKKRRGVWALILSTVGFIIFLSSVL